MIYLSSLLSRKIDHYHIWYNHLPPTIYVCEVYINHPYLDAPPPLGGPCSPMPTLMRHHIGWVGWVGSHGLHAVWEVSGVIVWWGYHVWLVRWSRELGPAPNHGLRGCRLSSSHDRLVLVDGLGGGSWTGGSSTWPTVIHCLEYIVRQSNE